mmetsp:Transcript_7950/g.18390  ORF Transcript_7950/g.18390 Transcript_7950/m.18390 type:complete len:88 (+) Transcript_7950:759-1022(+)
MLLQRLGANGPPVLLKQRGRETRACEGDASNSVKSSTQTNLPGQEAIFISHCHGTLAFLGTPRTQHWLISSQDVGWLFPRAGINPVG